MKIVLTTIARIDNALFTLDDSRNSNRTIMNTFRAHHFPISQISRFGRTQIYCTFPMGKPMILDLLPTNLKTIIYSWLV